MSEPVVIEIPYAPRKLQAQIHAALDAHRFATVVCHRRFGKTVMAVNHLIKRAILCQRERPRQAYIAPTYRQAKAIAWDYLKHYSAVIPGRVVNESELYVGIPNGARIRLFGADNPDALRGMYFDDVVLDEYGLQPANVFSEVIRPALSDREGTGLFIGTPNGKNQFYDVAQQAQTEPGWYFAEHKASATGIIPELELARARKSMTADEYAQEFECSFEASVKGAIYGREISLAREQKRIAKVPYDRAALVDTYWDLGIGDSTAIWFAQQIGHEIRLIDYYEQSGVGLDHYASVIAGKGYSYGRHVGPHDIEVRELGSGKSRLEMARGLGINFTVAPNLRLEDGINATRLMFDRLWIDAEKCEQGVEALMSYRWDYNERLEEFKPVPLHDWASHGADALRMLAVSLKAVEKKPGALKYSNKGIV